MPYCSRCGVEVDSHVENCPLCHTPIQKLDTPPDIPGHFPEDDMVATDYYIPFNQKKKIFWSVFSFLIATSLVIIFAVNFLLNRTITWGWIPLFSLLLTWGGTAVIYYLYNRIYILLTLLFTMTVIYLFFLLFVIQNVEVFFIPVLPVWAVTFFTVMMVVLFSKLSKRRGYNIVGFILNGSSLVCAGIDLAVHYYITSRISLTWSIVVIALAVPLSLLFYYLHYILKKTPNIKKIFHI